MHFLSSFLIGLSSIAIVVVNFSTSNRSVPGNQEKRTSTDRCICFYRAQVETLRPDEPSRRTRSNVRRLDRTGLWKNSNVLLDIDSIASGVTNIAGQNVKTVILWTLQHYKWPNLFRYVMPSSISPDTFKITAGHRCPDVPQKKKNHLSSLNATTSPVSDWKTDSPKCRRDEKNATACVVPVF